jgi:polyisoprenyl-phosphate glycosyltransferase
VHIGAIVPFLNEEEFLSVFLESIERQTRRPDRLVLVDDGSTDGSAQLLERLAAEDPCVRPVHLSRNFGHQAAVTAGLEAARGDAAVTIDADLQDPPEVILRLVEKWREGYDVVNAVREKRKEGLAKRFAYTLFYKVYRRLAAMDVPLDSGDFALMDRRVVDVMNALPEKNRFVRGLRSWSGFRQTGVAYERASRAAGETKYSFRKLLRLAFDGIVNFSTAPLSFIFGLGIATATIAMCAAAGYLVARIFEIPIFGYTPGEAPGFTTLILTILFFSGVQLMSIGILGEYLGRIYQEIKMRPTFVVKEVRGGREAAAVQPARAGERPARAL